MKSSFKNFLSLNIITQASSTSLITLFSSSFF